MQGKDNCARANGDGTNAKAYSVVAAEMLQSSDERYSYERPFFVACTGAITDDALTQLAEMRTQVPDDLERWDVVSLSFGGNNIRFENVLKGCLDINSVWGFFDLSPGCDVSEEQLRRRINMLTGRTSPTTNEFVGALALPEMYDAIAAAVRPGGHVVVLGYPQLVEEVDRWDWWRGNCHGVLEQDVGMIRSATGYLNEQIALTVHEADSRWQSSGIRFHFVDIATTVYEASGADSDRHGLCADNQWLNGISTGLTSGDWRPERSFHPTQIGHTSTGNHLAEVIRHLTFGGSQGDTAQTSTVPEEVEVQTGDVQATLIWSGDSDMDLHVVEPNGEEIYFSSPESGTGGMLDHDDIPDCGVETGDHVENIFWPVGAAPRGQYLVFVYFYNECTFGTVQSVQLTVRVNGQVVVSEAIVLAENQSSASYSFNSS